MRGFMQATTLLLQATAYTLSPKDITQLQMPTVRADCKNVEGIHPNDSEVCRKTCRERTGHDLPWSNPELCKANRDGFTSWLIGNQYDPYVSSPNWLNGIVVTKSAEECHKSCIKTPNCDWFAWNSNPTASGTITYGSCYLKSAEHVDRSPTVRRDQNFVTGFRENSSDGNRDILERSQKDTTPLKPAVTGIPTGQPDRSEPVVSTDRSEPVVSTDRSEPVVSTDRSGPVVSTDRSEPVVSTDRSEPGTPTPANSTEAVVASEESSPPSEGVSNGTKVGASVAGAAGGLAVVGAIGMGAAKMMGMGAGAGASGPATFTSAANADASQALPRENIVDLDESNFI